MDYETFKLIHSELIMSVQYIEQDLKLIYPILKDGEFYDNYSDVENLPLGKLLKSLHEMDQELGYSKIKEKDYELLNRIREIRRICREQRLPQIKRYIIDSFQLSAKTKRSFSTLAERLWNTMVCPFLGWITTKLILNCHPGYS